MTADQLVQHATNAVFIIVGLFAALRAVRHPRRANVDAALLFGALAIAVSVGELQNLLAIPPSRSSTFVTGTLVIAMPYLLIRLVEDFAAVPRLIVAVALGGLLLLAAGLAVLESPLPVAFTVLLVAYFAVAMLYASTRFVLEARRSSGVTRRRMSAAATGALLLGFALLAAGAALIVPAAAPLTRVLALASAVAYALAFATPGFLRHAWQAGDLRVFLERTAATNAATGVPAVIAELERAVSAVLAMAASIGTIDAERSVLRFVVEGVVREVPLEASASGRAFTEQRALFLEDAGRRYPPGRPVPVEQGARAALIAPVTIRDRRFGVLAARSERASIFAEDDLELLALLGGHVALILDATESYAALRRLNEELMVRVEDLRRANAEAAATNAELESFSYSVSHDLRAPLRSIDGFSAQLLKKLNGTLDADGRRYLRFLRESSQEMAHLIDDLLRLSRISRSEMRRATIDLSALAASIVEDLRRAEPGRSVRIEIEPGLSAVADEALVHSALENLFGNAWKFSARAVEPTIAFGRVLGSTPPTYFVRDNGAGFDMAYAHKLFAPFQRLHAQEEYPGTGIGLATVQRVVRRHGGTVWAEGAVGKGATFFFTLPSAVRRKEAAPLAGERAGATAEG